MFVKSVKIAQKAMFPIFRWKQMNQGEFNIGVGGTGFFINNDGYFVSTTHIFNVPDVKFLYMGRIPEEILTPPREIREVYKNDDLDIYIGRIEVETPDYFNLSKEVPDIGKSVCIAGYPLARITVNQRGEIEVGGVRRYFQPTFVLDKIIANNNDKGKIRKHDGFSVRDVGLFGMSGGPVFDVDGVVIGMQASVTDPQKSTNGSGREIIIENAVAIRSNLILQILNENNIKIK